MIRRNPRRSDGPALISWEIKCPVANANVQNITISIFSSTIYTSITEVKGLNPVGASEFFLGFFLQCCFTTVKIPFTCKIHTVT